MRNSKTPGAAVGYIRMSSDKQEESPEQQRDEILKLAEKHGYTIVCWYEDHAVSGVKTMKRKQFLQMIDDEERLGDFQAILCWDQDRFGRFDSIDTVKWIFDTYANTDANSRWIARDLNGRSILTRNGIPWQSQFVRVALRNPVYIGTMVYGANPLRPFVYWADSTASAMLADWRSERRSDSTATKFREEQRFELIQLRGILVGQIICLCPVFVDEIQLPRVRQR